MADLLNDKHVDAEQTFGCKIFSVSRTAEFFGWLEDVKSKMTADHADGLTWAYPKYRTKAYRGSPQKTEESYASLDFSCWAYHLVLRSARNPFNLQSLFLT
jgi:hypothetical protein